MMSIEKLSNLKYDYLDLMIVEALGKFGPRNLYKISKQLEIPESTLRYRINRLKSQKLLYLHTNIYHANIGLKKGVVFVDSNQKYSRLIYDFLTCNDYWVNVKRTHTVCEGCWALYVIPYERTYELKKFLDEMVKLDIIWNYTLYWSTCFYRVNPNTKWFDLKENNWKFDWNGLVNDFEDASTNLPLTLKDPSGFPILCDEMDLFILKELEKDATISLKDIAKKMRTTPQNLLYHYKQHIIKNFLIEDFQIGFARFDLETSVTPIFVIDFYKWDYLAKMVNTLRDKPFVEILGKVLGRNTLLLTSYLPINEFFNMLETFNIFVETGVIKKFNYYLRSFSDKGRRDIIPYHLFNDGRWIYEHEKYIARLHEKLKDIKRKLGN